MNTPTSPECERAIKWLEQHGGGEGATILRDVAIALAVQVERGAFLEQCLEEATGTLRFNNRVVVNDIYSYGYRHFVFPNLAKWLRERKQS